MEHSRVDHLLEVSDYLRQIKQRFRDVLLSNAHYFPEEESPNAFSAKCNFVLFAVHVLKSLVAPYCWNHICHCEDLLKACNSFFPRGSN